VRLWILVCLLAVLALFAVFLLLPVSLKITYEDGFKVKFNIGFIKFSLTKKKKKANKAENGEKGKSEPEKGLKKAEGEIDKLGLLYDLLGDFRDTLRKKTTLSVKLRINIGTMDAASTAIICGSLWAVIYNLLFIIDTFMHIEDMDVDVKPNFNESEFKWDFEGIIKSRVVHIIFILIKYLEASAKNKSKN